MNQTKSVIRDRIDQIQVGLKIAEVFLAKYESKLPPELGSFMIWDNVPRYSINLQYDEENRDKILTLFGDVFGRADWKSKLEYQGRHYNWTKTLDGVLLIIECAQATSQPDSFPVDPKQFPLQLL